MNQHKRVVQDTIKHLYARISNPLASDFERKRIALKALDQIDGEGDDGGGDGHEAGLGGMTVAQVQTEVEADRISAEEALDYERDHENRKTLIAWLEDWIEDREE